MHPVAPTPAGGYRALVIDDEVALATIVASYLEREHFEVGVATTGSMPSHLPAKPIPMSLCSIWHYWASTAWRSAAVHDVPANGPGWTEIARALGTNPDEARLRLTGNPHGRRQMALRLLTAEAATVRCANT